jgi:hypothetical protein
MSNSFTPLDKRWFKEFLSVFDEVNLRSDTSACMRCPDPHGRHTHGDKNPSMTADLSQNGSGPTALLRCHSQQCDVGAVLEAVGKEVKDLYPGNQDGKEPNALPGCTLAEYAASKQVPMDFLSHELVSLENSTYQCKVSKKRVPAVWIPYMDESGGLVAERYRTGLHKPTTGDDIRFRWKKGSAPSLYGRNWLDIAREASYVFLVEGESDCHAAWYHEVPAVGIPGAQLWRNEWGVILDGIDTLIVTVEDEAGEQLFKAVSACKRLAGRLERTVIR